MSVAVSARGLTKSYRDADRTVDVLRGVDLDLEPGELVAVVGPSGSGKSTLLHLLGGLDRPDAGSIEAMGSKSAAKARMLKAKVPCVPGYQGDEQSDEQLLKHCRKVGLPVMIKAAAGGGGRGMRLVEDEARLVDAIKSARSEAANAFGSGELLVEKAVVDGRHVEIQMLGDAHGGRKGINSTSEVYIRNMFDAWLGYMATGGVPKESVAA